MSRLARLLAALAVSGPLAGCASAPARPPSPPAIAAAAPASAPAKAVTASAGVPADAADGGQPVTCSGTLSGAVAGAFTCDVTAAIAGDIVTLKIVPLGGVAGVRTLVPADFELAMPLRPGTFSRDALGGSAVVELVGGQRYTASARRGEVSLVLESAERYAQARGFYVVSGALTAHLVGDGALRDEVVVEARF